MTTAISILTMWLMLYLNDADLRLSSPWAGVLWVVTLLCPSACFWLLWMGSRFREETEVRQVMLSWGVIAVASISVNVVIALLPRALLQDIGPMIGSAFTASYVSGLVLGLAFLVQWPQMRNYVRENRLLGPLALVAAASLAAGVWAATSLFKVSTIIGLFGSSLLDMFCLMTILVAFLSLLNVTHFQAVLGVAALVGMALTFLSPIGVFFSIWLNGVMFWPFVILCSLALQAILVRLLHPSIICGPGGGVGRHREMRQPELSD